jgi:hypothetical protein
MKALAARRAGSRISPLFLGVQLLLLVLAVSRYDATSFVYRWGDEIDFFNWFWRHRTLGFLSFFDFLVLALLGLAGAGIVVSGRWRPRPFDALIYVLLVVVASAGAIHFLQLDVEDTPRGFLYQLRNYGYFAAAYGLASRVRWSGRRLRWFSATLAGLAILTMALSWWELRQAAPGEVVMKYGRTVAVRDLSDYVFLFFLQFWAMALLLERAAGRWWLKALLLGIAIQGLYAAFTGVGRGVLVVYLAVLLYFAWHYRLVYRRWFVTALSGGLVLVATRAAYMLLKSAHTREESPLYVYTTVSTRDLSTATRVRELMNFGGNLYHRHALLLGIGLGNKWYEFWEQPRTDLGAYPREEWASDWHLGMHVPFVRLVLDFGVLGAGAVLVLFGTCFLVTMRAVRAARFDGVARAFMVASWAVIGYQVSINNLSGPKTTLVAGLLLGAVAGILSQPASAEQG